MNARLGRRIEGNGTYAVRVVIAVSVAAGNGIKDVRFARALMTENGQTGNVDDLAEHGHKLPVTVAGQFSR